MDREEGIRLYETALEASRNGPCLEIGSYCGKSAVYIGSACKVNGSILYSIDHHRGSEEQQPGEAYFDPETYSHKYNSVDTFPLFRRTIFEAKFEDTIVPIVAPSVVAARGWLTPLSLVFIDGGHSDETARMDYESWAGHILSGGYLMIHDLFENPQDGGQAPYRVYQAALADGRFLEMPRTKTLGVLKRR
ncbi:MAG: class I SAM-dependent methyltransferase [Desulfobacterales bacterium]|nr:class I SAM-dependent methyltransferase [Desulfobacterales bacterium]